MPYITASIIFQLLTVVYEPLARIQKEGELGRRKITQWTRYLTVLLGALQSIGIAAILTRQGLVLNPGAGFIAMTVITLTTGTAFGSLALSGHPGTASMGVLLLISLGCTLVASLIFVPSVLAALGPSMRGA